MKTLDYLITGTGRSGTVYMARWFTSLGIPCGHESIYDWRGARGADIRLAGEDKISLSLCSTAILKDGTWAPIPKWLESVDDIVAESSYMAAPFLEDIKSQGTKVLHVVRNPVNVINSFCNYINYFSSAEATNIYEQFIYRHLPSMKQELSQYDRCALYYCRWNKMIEQHADLTWAIERNPNVVTNWLGVKGEEFEDKSVNSFQRPAPQFYLNDLESGWVKSELIETARGYGYNLSENLFL